MGDILPETFEDAGLVDIMTASNIGFKIVEMAGRVKNIDKLQPGVQATWGVEMDGVEYKITVSVKR